ncbi:type II secretion system protein [Staphylococcus simiae]|uniref:competence type IV pilus minor pilin ComGD n=1 Tax=Staphylococcus simiae TaxID=308354 RepID=UPI001A96039D|nr:competence type IV pilus minor pilin ComGD [Staphylococcus simiae]MBO1197937.1 type II secretion system protein [Staphylococcus simiae]MBO1200414.1 type II secretion system protein [Staphylococcus simiae]MBO1202687.1 type II secretion system protein [Staphylococcus simiae]MBO1209928.1 type II secretion system protein [Staphylococcus simiae]MBO1228831.1 type II secretion system protein [Staphylococcus simiae]
MEKQLSINKIKAFTMIEMLLVLLMISIILLTTLTSKSLRNLETVNSEMQLSSFILQLDYLKSKAIITKSPILIQFIKHSNQAKVTENNKTSYFLTINNAEIININKVHYLYFDKRGNIKPFGSITIKVNKAYYKVIFHIEKGRVRYEKL